MFKRPEELIVAVLAALWVVLAYLAADYLGAPAQTKLLISALTLICTALCFILWQRNLSRAVWPFFLGMLTACWWPYLDWMAVRDILVPGAESSAIIINKPWYAGWTFKTILAAAPVVLGYAVKWKLHSKHKHKAVD
ncbi:MULTISPECIES: hypothetical protein [Neisseria]|uniref:Membrane protein n=1 Tax=Neisseria musculi TaxID=1815583 RepID=A0A7H1M7X7_9NEIS|nr:MULTISPECIES: hypothetical protein [Neisseria]MBF0803439.1 hypothetical protein [Neisseria sp. 19428wB4_WF04]QNT57742.1 putative membrane protein [Neisseria musculi]TFU43840.1 hypothetical protein E4T99_03570 [Neisseria sp. WF04]